MLRMELMLTEVRARLIPNTYLFRSNFRYPRSSFFSILMNMQDMRRRKEVKMVRLWSFTSFGGATLAAWKDIHDLSLGHPSPPPYGWPELFRDCIENWARVYGGWHGRVSRCRSFSILSSFLIFLMRFYTLIDFSYLFIYIPNQICYPQPTCYSPPRKMSYLSLQQDPFFFLFSYLLSLIPSIG